MTTTRNFIDGGNILAAATYLGVFEEEVRGKGWVGQTDRQDFYKFSVHQPGDFDFALIDLQADANIQLLNSDGNRISGSYNTGTQYELKTYENLAAGDYYFKIYSGSNTNYELRYKHRPSDPGNSISQALNMGLANHNQPKQLFGSLSPTDKYDFYRFSTDKVGVIDFSLSGLSANANVQLLNSAGNTITGSYNTGTQDEQKTYRNLAPGDYYFKIYSGSNTNYDFDFEFYEEIATYNGTNGDDSLRGSEREDLIYGGNGTDSLYGDGGNDTIYGENGNDSLFGDNGNDYLNGQNDIDFLYGGAGKDKLYGGNGNDFVRGDEDNDTLYGNNGRDRLKGGDGNDILSGDADRDTLIGGAGSDRFMYSTNTAFNTNHIGVDIIEDFGDGDDKFLLKKKTFSALASVDGYGFSVANEFAVVSQDSQVANSSALIVYSTGTGNLFYNQNGSSDGFGSGGQFATLLDVDTLTASDFIIRN